MKYIFSLSFFSYVLIPKTSSTRKAFTCKHQLNLWHVTIVWYRIVLLLKICIRFKKKMKKKLLYANSEMDRYRISPKKVAVKRQLQLHETK